MLHLNVLCGCSGSRVDNIATSEFTYLTAVSNRGCGLEPVFGHWHSMLCYQSRLSRGWTGFSGRSSFPPAIIWTSGMNMKVVKNRTLMIDPSQCLMYPE